MCGSTQQQADIEQQQQEFQLESMKEQQAAYQDDQALLKQMQGVYAPIFTKGPSQEGFSPEQKAALATQIKEGTATNYAQAAQATNANLAATGGGNLVIPSGQQAQMKAQVAQAAAQEESGEQLQATNANYAQGYNNWLQAGQGLFGISGQMNPLGYGEQVNTAGKNAADTANQIATQQNSWINAAIGAAGTIAGGWATGGFKMPGASSS
jgi:hypothetical protein